MSLKARLLAGIGVIVVVLVLALGFMYRRAEAGLMDQIDQRLAQSNDAERRGPFENWEDQLPVYAYIDVEARRITFPGPGGGGGPERFAPERLSDVYEGYVYQTGSEYDGVLLTVFTPNTGDGTDEVDPGPEADLESIVRSAERGEPFIAQGTDDTRYRVQARQTDAGNYVVTALSLDDTDETLDRLLLAEGIGAAAIVAVLGLVAWWVIRLGIRPIESMTATATAIATGDMSHRVDTAHDRTEAGRLGTALNQMLGTIEASFDQRDQSEAKLRQFVADASHELRTPITTIRGYAELYRLGGLSGEGELDEALRRTQQEAVRMSRLIDDLLTLARLDQRRPMESAPVDLSRLVADAARDANAVDPDRAVTSSHDGDVQVLGDDDRLRQVIANVVGNALVHTPTTAAVDISARRAGAEVVVTVADQGPGMTAEQAQRATERFFRVDPARSRHQGGSGLGLSIADTTVAAHGGRLAVTSEPGHGTTVTITLPALAS